MSTGTSFPIAQLSFQGPAAINLAHVISDLRNVFERILPVAMTTTWDQDHLAVLEFGALRVVLCLDDDADISGPNRLTMAFVPRPEQDLTESARERLRATEPTRIRTIAEWLVSKAMEHQRPINVTWSTICGSASVDEIEQKSEDMANAAAHQRRQTPLAHFCQPVSETEVDIYLSRIPAKAKSKAQPLRAPADSAFSILRRVMQYATTQSSVGQVAMAMAVVPIGVGLGANVLGPSLEITPQTQSVQYTLASSVDIQSLPALAQEQH